jgi:catechol 2,3-dioxygenase-like lactoylglutathione lyase family enzyme
MIGSNDFEKTKTFYNAVLSVLGAGAGAGAGAPMEHVNDTGQTRLFYIHKGNTFSISEPIKGEPVTVANGSTVGFACDSPEQVVELHDVAIANGGRSVPRENTTGLLHLSYFLDPDGHKFADFIDQNNIGNNFRLLSRTFQ